MPRTEKNLELANLICRFGENLVLLDLFDEVFYPAISDQSLTRSYEETTYLIQNVAIVPLGTNTIGVAGRFIKDTVLKREQVLNPGGVLVKDEDEIRSSPSALFCLILPGHRLLYLKETKDAPGLYAFKSTIKKFLTTKHQQFIDAAFEKHKEERNIDRTIPYVSKKSLYERYPWPDLEIVPLATEQSLSSFVDNYEKLATVQVQLLESNDELDNNGFFAAMRNRQGSIGSDKTTLTHHSANGLDKAEAISQLSAAVGQGNSLVTMSGKDSNGDTLKGNNEEFQLRVPVPNVGNDIPAASQQMHGVFKQLVDDGLVPAPTTTDSAIQKVAAIIAAHE